MSNDKKRKSSYVPLPKADPETLQRLNVVVLVQTGQLSVSEAAQILGMSRLHFQTLKNRALTALVDALTPKLPGRPSGDPKMRELRERVKDLEDENEDLTHQLEQNEQLIR